MVKVRQLHTKKKLRTVVFHSTINKKEQTLDFITLRFIERKENIVFSSSSIMRETHLATSTGIAVAKKAKAPISLSRTI